LVTSSPNTCFSGRLARIAPLLSNASHVVSPESLRDNHTLFPIVAPFIPSRRFDHYIKATSDACNRGQHFAHLHSILQLHSTTPLKYCDKCRQADIRRIGEACLYRSHQLPQALVCHHHCVPLT